MKRNEKTNLVVVAVAAALSFTSTGAIGADSISGMVETSAQAQTEAKANCDQTRDQDNSRVDQSKNTQEAYEEHFMPTIEDCLEAAKFEDTERNVKQAASLVETLAKSRIACDDGSNTKLHLYCKEVAELLFERGQINLANRLYKQAIALSWRHGYDYDRLEILTDYATMLRDSHQSAQAEEMQRRANWLGRQLENLSG